MNKTPHAAFAVLRALPLVSGGAHQHVVTEDTSADRNEKVVFHPIVRVCAIYCGIPNFGLAAASKMEADGDQVLRMDAV